MRPLPVAFLSALSLLLAALPAQRPGPGGPGGQGGPGGGRFGRGDDEAPKLANFTYEQGTLKSDKVHRGDAGYAIYLPKGYADEKNKDVKFPYVVWLHGFGGSGEFLGGGGAQVLDKLAGDGVLPPLAMVVFRAPNGRTTYMNGESTADVEDLIAQDLLPQLEAKYRLDPAREHRALMGVSMGGMGALRIAFHHPELFGTVAVHSAAILPTDPKDLPEMYQRQVQRAIQSGGLDKVLGNPIDPAKWAEQMPLSLVAAKKPEDLKGMNLYFDAGTADRYGFCAPNEQLDKLMTEKGYKHLFRKIEGGGHAWSSPSMKECLAVSLQFVGAAFAGKDPIAAAKALDAAKATEKPAEKPAETGAGK